jgi:hypothetical protein
MLRLDFLGRFDVADMLMLAASVVVVVTTNRDLSCRRQRGPAGAAPLTP